MKLTYYLQGSSGYSTDVYGKRETSYKFTLCRFVLLPMFLIQK